MWRVIVATLLADGLGATDCEAIGAGWLAQPVNAISSLGYVLAGAWVLWRSHSGDEAGRTGFWVATSLLSVGVGSFLFHGPMPPAARWIHDATIVVLLELLVMLAAAGLRKWPQHLMLRRWALLAALSAAVVALVPGSTTLLAAVAIAVMVVVEGLRWRQPSSPQFHRGVIVSAVFLLGAGLFYVMGRTGGPWCDPAGGWQGHAVWHVLTALAFARYGTLLLVAGPPGWRSEPAPDQAG